jgi:ubiquinol-cytochrome c reductase cytochrome c1 subunit
MTKLLASIALLFAPVVALAAGGGDAPPPAYTTISDQGSLQRGAKLFVNYCLSCHSAKYMRYARVAEDLGLSEEEVQKNLNFTGAKFGEQMTVAMSPEDAALWFGAAPPDLSLTARSRGVDWISDYLKSFYVDPSRPVGWNNTRLPNASMPNVLWELQGTQRAVLESDGHGGTKVARLELDPNVPGRLSKTEYDRAVRDLTTFLEYVGEPAVLKRDQYGVWVVLFLAAFTFLAWLLKHEWWKDVH